MSSSTLIRWGGLALAVGGISIAGFFLGLVGLGSLTATSVESPRLYLLAHGLHTIGGALAVLGLVALYAREYERLGRMGLIGFVLAMIGTSFFAGLGLPGLCGFIGEAFVVLSTWNYDPLLAILAASGRRAGAARRYISIPIRGSFRRSSSIRP